MTRWTQSLLATALLIGPTVAMADPIDLSHVPADSKWVAHLDMDAARKSATWKTLYERLQQNFEFQAKVNELETIFNARFPDDLHDVTLAGAAFGDTAGVALIHANVDRRQIENGLAHNPGYASEPRGAHSLLTWTDKGKTNYGGFYSDNLFMIGQDKDRVSTLIDTLDGKTAPMKADTPLGKGADTGVMVYVAGDELAKLKQGQDAKTPFLSQTKSAWLGLTEDKGELILKVNVTANDAASATKMKSMVDGLYAALSLSADRGDELTPDKPQPKAGIELIKNLTAVATVTDNVMVLELSLPQKDVPAIIDQVVAKKENEGRPARRPEPVNK